MPIQVAYFKEYNMAAQFFRKEILGCDCEGFPQL